MAQEARKDDSRGSMCRVAAVGDANVLQAQYASMLSRIEAPLKHATEFCQSHTLP